MASSARASGERRPVEEAEVAVAVQLGVGHRPPTAGRCRRRLVGGAGARPRRAVAAVAGEEGLVATTRRRRPVAQPSLELAPRHRRVPPPHARTVSNTCSYSNRDLEGWIPGDSTLDTGSARHPTHPATYAREAADAPASREPAEARAMDDPTPTEGDNDDLARRVAELEATVARLTAALERATGGTRAPVGRPPRGAGSDRFRGARRPSRRRHRRTDPRLRRRGARWRRDQHRRRRRWPRRPTSADHPRRRHGRRGRARRGRRHRGHRLTRRRRHRLLRQR